MEDVRFGPTVDETVDVFPAKKQGAPLLVFIHGGYWFQYSSKDFSLVVTGPISRGVTVVMTNYSLCPRVTIAEITRQSRAVIAWLHREAPNFNADSTRIFVVGHSVGGQQVGKVRISTSRALDRRYWSPLAKRNQRSLADSQPTSFMHGAPTDCRQNYWYRKVNTTFLLSMA